MNLVSVIPLTYLPRPEAQVYTYFTTKTDLQPGGLVKVFLGRRQVAALMKSVRALNSEQKTELRKASFTLKPLGEVISTQRVVDEATLKFIEEFSIKFGAPLALCTKLFVPSQLIDQKPNYQWPRPLIRSENQNVLNISGADRLTRAVGKIKAVLAKGQQVLVLVPYQARLKAWKKLDLPITFFSSKLSNKKRLTIRQAAIEGQAQLIIGTRAALFLPIPNLGLILIDEAQSDTHYFLESQPYYDTRRAAYLRGVTVIPTP